MGQSNVKLDASAIEKQRQTQFESELAAADLAFVRKQALEIARRRERFHWEALGACTLTAALMAIGVFTRRNDVAVPCVPLMFFAGYRYDSAYGEQLETIRNNAERHLKESPERFVRPGGPITVAEIDRLRAQMYGTA